MFTHKIGRSVLVILHLTGLLVDILTPTIEWLNVKTINFPSPFWYPFSEQYYWGGHSFKAGDNLGIKPSLWFWVPFFLPKMEFPRNVIRISPATMGLSQSSSRSKRGSNSVGTWELQTGSLEANETIQFRLLLS